METTIEMSASSRQYYVIARRWAADLEFFKIETAFLHRLQQEYFIRLSDPRHLERLRLVGMKLNILQKDMNVAGLQNKIHLELMELIEKNIMTENTAKLGDQSSALEKLFAKLIAEYREVKKELFTLVESVMRENKD